MVARRDTKTEFARRLHAAADAAGIPSGRGRRAALAKLFRVSGESARKWMEGLSLPDTKRIPLIARELGVRGEWLLTGQGPMRPDTVREVASSGRRVPVISAIQAGEPREVVDAYERGDGFDAVTVPERMARDLSPHAFALVVEGESMLPRLRPGDIVIVDPDKAPKPGSIVVAKLEREEAATIKKYRPRGVDESGHEVFELVPLNEDWPTILVDSRNPGRIVGVASKLWTDLK